MIWYMVCANVNCMHVCMYVYVYVYVFIQVYVRGSVCVCVFI
jgi:hypothetical protein